MKYVIGILFLLCLIVIVAFEKVKDVCIDDGGEWVKSGALILVSTYPTPIFAEEFICKYPKDKGV